ncbi:MAG: uroporphyrinogen decarboxylase family protein [Acidimicrobiia bacterium]
MRLDPAKTYPQFRAGAERMTQAWAKGETPDRVPVFAQHHEFSLRRFGLDCEEFYRDPELMVAAQVETCAQLGLDLPTVDWDCYNVEAEAIGQQILFDADSMPDVDRDRPLVATPSDVEKITAPDFGTAGRCREIVT